MDISIAIVLLHKNLVNVTILKELWSALFPFVPFGSILLMDVWCICEYEGLIGIDGRGKEMKSMSNWIQVQIPMKKKNTNINN
jgi:hypothetical protein